MRICYICVGGFAHIAPYLNYFKEAGHDVCFISLSPAPDYGVPTYNVGLWGQYSPTTGKWKYPISILRARRIVRKLKPDIVHTHYITSGGLAGLMCGFHPTITTVHGSDLNEGIQKRFWRFLFKLIFNHSDCVNTCNEEQKRKVMALGVAAEKIRVLTPGVDTDKFSFGQRQIKGRNQPLRMTTTRQLEKKYGHQTVIQALSILRSKGVDFQMTFVGDGPLLEELKSQVKREGLTDCVRFSGRVDKSRIIEILHNNDIFLSTPFYDGISIALLEAMATGLFPIVTDLEVNSDWLEDGVDGLLYKPGDVDALASCILKIYNNPRLAVSAAQRNRSKVVKSGDTQTNMKLLEQIYEELVRKTDRETI
jgi:glycosyltransferase involved in cell wall biosynthesis